MSVSQRQAAVPIIRAFAALKKAHLPAFQRLQQALVRYGQPEYENLLKGEKRRGLAQGRAQIVDELINIMDQCAELDASYEQQERKNGTS